ncbi:MAG: oligogalacturonate lyase family protein [Lentisphaeria bacterium]|nr:MAG: oligogalacturonate lyase family protein [Lentisphaeria bacterium]
MEQMTSEKFADAQLLYFTGSSLNISDEWLYFISSCSGGSPNIFRKHLAHGTEEQLTFQHSGILKSYVYFDGTPYRGFGKASVVLDDRRDIVYYIHGLEIHKITNGEDRILANYPHGQMTAFCHVSPDGKRLCVPTVDAEALRGEEQLPAHWNIDECVQRLNLSSFLRIYDTETGRELQCIEIPRCWITHVQFSPTNPEQILYNHEWASDCGIRRMWLWDDRLRKSIRLRNAEEGRSGDDWVCHEIWTADGKEIIYHGKLARGRFFIGKYTLENNSRIELEIPEAYTGYGHFTMHSRSLLVSDGYYCKNENPGGHDIISLQQVDWEQKHIRWIPLCRHASSWNCQCSHPHPIFDHAGRNIYFTSDRNGYRAIFRCTTADSERDVDLM